MANLKFQKVNGSLPTTLEADTVYLLKTPTGVEMHVSDSTGASSFRVGGAAQQGSAEDPIDPFLLMGVSSA